LDLQLRESPEEGVYVAGLKEVLVTRLEDCLELLKLGERNRQATVLLHGQRPYCKHRYPALAAHAAEKMRDG
jgi:hypothetical protein